MIAATLFAVFCVPSSGAEGASQTKSAQDEATALDNQKRWRAQQEDFRRLKSSVRKSNLSDANQMTTWLEAQSFSSTFKQAVSARLRIACEAADLALLDVRRHPRSVILGLTRKAGDYRSSPLLGTISALRKVGRTEDARRLAIEFLPNDEELPGLTEIKRADQLSDAAHRLISVGEFKKAERLIESLPEQVGARGWERRTRDWLWIAMAIRRLDEGDIDDVLRTVDRCKRPRREIPRYELRGFGAALYRRLGLDKALQVAATFSPGVVGDVIEAGLDLGAADAGRLADIQRAFWKTIPAIKNDNIVWTNGASLARAYLQAGDPGAAERVLQRATDEDADRPNSFEAIMLLRSDFARSTPNKMLGVVRLLERRIASLEAKDQPRALAELALFHWQRGDRNESQRLRREAERIGAAAKDDVFPAGTWADQLDWTEGRTDEVLRRFDANKYSPFSSYRIAIQWRGTRQQDLHLLERLAAGEVKGSNQAAEKFGALAVVAAGLGFPERASNALSEAVRIDPVRSADAIRESGRIEDGWIHLKELPFDSDDPTRANAAQELAGGILFADCGFR